MENNYRRKFIKQSLITALMLAGSGTLACGREKKYSVPDGSQDVKKGIDSFFKTRGIVLSWEDISSLDWPMLASKAGLTTISVHTSDMVMQSEAFRKFLESCRGFNIDVEYEQHAMSELLPRNLFSKDQTMFRMDEKGLRVKDFNCCVSSKDALEIIKENVLARAVKQVPSSGRYYYWLDDGGKKCHCPSCKDLNDSDQALVVENEIIKSLRKLDASYTLAHLAYQETMKIPKYIKPDPGIFLEYAPFYRRWDKPLSDKAAKRDGQKISHGEYLEHLDANLQIFPVATAQILEYWLDVSLFSDWKKPAVKLPWNKDVFVSDIDTYAKRGIKNITTFGVYIDKAYQDNHKDLSFLQEYGDLLKDYKPV